MTIWPLAWKNLFRYRRRTIITAGTLAIGIFFYIFMDSLLKGADIETEQNLILYETASARIYRTDFWQEREYKPLEHSLERERIEPLLREKGLSYAPRIDFNGELIFSGADFPEEGSLSMGVIAIDPALDKDVYKIGESLSQGEFLKEGEPGVLIGEWLARDIEAEIGYSIHIVTKTAYGAYQDFDVTVVGFLNTPNPIINKGGVYIPLDVAQRFLDMEGEVTSISLSFPGIGGEEERLKSLSLPEEELYTTVTWEDMAVDFIAMSATKKQGGSVMILLVLVIAAVGISNTMLMTILERIRELGMVRALGLQDSDIVKMITAEAFGIGLLGSTLGIAASIPLNFYLIKKGIDYTWMIEQMDVGYRITGIFRGAWSVETMVTAFFLGVIASTAVAIGPALKAVRMSIPATLRYA